jgi:hypothetical protein
MVDITYQMMLSTLQTAGLLVGIFYYVTTLRNAQKNRMINLVFQRMQTRSPEYFRESLDINPSMWDWETVEEFHSKYNWKRTPNILAQRKSIEDRFTAWGMLLKEGLVSIEFVAKVFPPAFVMTWWERNEPLYQDERRVTNNPEHYEDLEYLYNALKRKYPEITRNPIYVIDKNEKNKT